MSAPADVIEAATESTALRTLSSLINCIAVSRMKMSLFGSITVMVKQSCSRVDDPSLMLAMFVRLHAPLAASIICLKVQCLSRNPLTRARRGQCLLRTGDAPLLIGILRYGATHRDSEIWSFSEVILILTTTSGNPSH